MTGSPMAGQAFGGAYAGRRVFVTGATGFKGSWLAQWLVELGAEVTGYSLYYPSDPCHYGAIGLGRRIRHVKGDVRNLRSLRRALDQAAPDVVFHLAAQPILRASYDDPVGTFSTNVLGTVNVLEWMREARSLKAGVIVTSDKCYENVEQMAGYVESDRLGGKDPYSASKAGAEIAFSAYVRSFFAHPRRVTHATAQARGRCEGVHETRPAALLASARAGNVIGGGDWAKDRIVPDCVRAWAAKVAPVLRNPASTRPWQHVLEPLGGYLWLGARLLRGDQSAHGEAFNFGPPSDVNESVAKLIAEIRRFWPGTRTPRVQRDATAKPEAGLLRLDCGKARALLAWHPTLTFAETAEWTAAWYHGYLEDPRAALRLTRAQIAEYCRLASARGQAWMDL